LLPDDVMETAAAIPSKQLVRDNGQRHVFFCRSRAQRT
jgi:hypothetical protein